MATPSSSSAPSDDYTTTQKAQLQLEDVVLDIFESVFTLSPHDRSLALSLLRDRHIDYVMRGLKHLGPNYTVLDANRPWLCYWILHSVFTLGYSVDPELKQNTIDFLCRCQDSEGGYGGGPGQMPHLATTYAAVNTLVTLGGDKALSSINREKMLQFLLRMKDPSGGFRMHDAGEMDVRGCYTAISVASMLNILNPSLIANVSDYIVSCQTYEGGIAGEPGAEAHGGYTFCGVAALVLINEVHRLDLPSLLDWAAFRQGKIEGGFQGRTNKLVDGCYSFWQGGIFPILQRVIDILQQQISMSYVSKERSANCHVCMQENPNPESSVAQNISSFDENTKATYAAERLFPAIDCFNERTMHIEPVEEESDESKQVENDCMRSKTDCGLTFLNKDISCGPLFNAHALQGYLLLCSQFDGGLRDKPGKIPDHYHTCYCLSGLSAAQYSWSHRTGAPPPPNAVLGPFTNLLEPVHPLHNVVLQKYHEAQKYFLSLT
eukprot:TRINITY_DN17454_c0_g1_i1.p1 TRINITY_DN17454_c0_g1~~TRINITY_DN17454_c0_g1_i1.p1  ORF type:complete len:491 (+),score=85.85 TRINITY_DN17454_c0_g1_i1:159-1631(+)